MFRMRAWLLTLTAIFCLSSTGIAEPAGEITRLVGGAFAFTGESSRNLQRGGTLETRARILTAPGARVGIRFVDGTQITLGGLTDFEVQRFRFEPTERRGEALFSLVRGVFRAVTGELGALPNKPFQVKTPLATIGIRGTDFWGEQSTDRLQLALLDGAGVIVVNRFGRVEITKPGDGTLVVPGKAPSQPRPWSDAKLARAKATID